jgi:hypothetical protein
MLGTRTSLLRSRAIASPSTSCSAVLIAAVIAQLRGNGSVQKYWRLAVACGL